MQLLLYAISGKILAILVGLFYLRSLSLPYKLLIVQVVVAMFCESYGRYIVMRYHEQNLWVFKWYWLIGELWLMGLIGRAFITNKQLKAFIAYGIGLGTIAWCLGVYTEGLNTFSPWSMVVPYVILVVTYLAVLFKSALSSSVALVKQPSFWLSASVLLFFSCNIPLFGLFNYLNKVNPELLNRLFDINLVLNFIRYPLVGVAFYLQGKQREITPKANSHVI